MHPKNKHQGSYDFDILCQEIPELKEFTFVNAYGTTTLDFSNPEAVVLLNKALLSAYYSIKQWNIPDGYLCPPIPGRADYIHHIADLFEEETPRKGLDIGTGANAIYPLLGNAMYGWEMVGADIQEASIAIAKENTITVNAIDIRYQNDNAQLFAGIIKKDEYFDFTMCNPPFYASAKEAAAATNTKSKNLGFDTSERNFGGQANELWCNGGEALFIKRLIKQSVLFKDQVSWFTTLVSRKQHLPKIYKQLDKLKCTHKTIEMSQGNKQSRFVAWTF